MTESSKAPTPERLIAAGLELYGRNGFEATSTRELAAHAKTNVASIAYHFESKDGLRRACARFVAQKISTALGGIGSIPTPLDRTQAKAQIEMILRMFAQLILGAPAATDFVPFVLREITQPGPILDLMYEEFIGARHHDLCALWAAATQREADEEDIKLTVFAAMGQILYFRIAKSVVERRMGWSGMDRDEITAIQNIILANVNDMIERQHR